MASLLNRSRPPVFCPGCSHDRVVRALDESLEHLGIAGEDVVLVTDIGCSGLFDVFFHTHAFHGLHGRALTYALGLKMARPEMHVIVTMGDGGLGIGGAHVLSSCRRNADLTLLVLNNFNFGMTGGQYSSTTPSDARTSSKFLNQLEQPLDICKIADAAGAPFVVRCSGLEKGLASSIAEAITYNGLSVVDIWGICPGRFSRKNSLTPQIIRDKIRELRKYEGVQQHNERVEFSSAYSEAVSSMAANSTIQKIPRTQSPIITEKREVLILGSAGQRVVTAGEILGFAAMSSGTQVTQKNDYDITVLKGPSVSEIILWSDHIGFTGITNPDVVLVVSNDGVKRRKSIFSRLKEDSLIIHDTKVDLPECRGQKIGINFKSRGISSQDMALATLAVLANRKIVMTPDMLDEALRLRFTEKIYLTSKRMIEKLA